MIIILEGPDGAGKSVLAETLKIRLTKEGWTVVSHHHGPYPELKDPSLYYLTSMRRRVHAGLARYAVILDRSWLSEPIYGQALRGGIDRVGLGSRRMLERVALRCGALVVKCYPPYATAKANWARRKGLELTDDNAAFDKIYEGYLLTKTDLPVIMYDYTGERGQLDRILEIAIAEAERAKSSPKDGIGYWHEDSVLLVGDRVSQYGWPDLPFVAFKRGGCSAWLAEKLEAWGVREHQLYWLNAYRQSPELLGWPQAPRRVIALGTLAGSWLDRAGVEHMLVQHPQAHKRFHHHEEYLGLKEALLR
jgi:hypothetical protein